MDWMTVATDVIHGALTVVGGSAAALVVLERIAALTPTTKDDKIIAGVRSVVDAALPILKGLALRFPQPEHTERKPRDDPELMGYEAGQVETHGASAEDTQDAAQKSDHPDR